MNKRKLTILLISLISLLILSAAIYFLNQRFHFLADALDGPYVIFQKENFAQVSWDSIPEKDVDKFIKNGSVIDIFAAKGQTEDVSFSVRPNEDLGEVQINLTDLKMGDKIISKENIEALNLKVWPQCAPEATSPNANWVTNCQNTNFKTPTYNEALYRTISKDMPELLVKNNEQDLQAAEGGMVKNADNSYTYNAPAVDPNFKAILKAGQTHTFYLRIKVPSDALEGDYQATGEFVPSNNIQPTSFKLAMKVLPLVLPESDKDIATYVGYRIDDKFIFQQGRQGIGEEKFAKYLDFLKSAGFTSLVINDYNNIDKVAKMMKDRGFKRIIWNAIPYPNGEWLNPNSMYKAETIKNKIRQIKAAGYDEVYVYGYDEPNEGAKLFKNIEYAKFIHESGAKVATAIMKQTYDISNTKLLLHDMAGASVEEGKIDLPIYAGAFSNSAYYGDYVSQYFDRSWYFPLVGDVPSFQVFPRSEAVNNKTTVNKYTTALSKNTWHHIAGVWDGKTNQYKLYVDNQAETDFEFSTTTATSPFGNMLPKNPNRTYIGAYIDAIKPLSNGKSRDAVLGFRGKIAGVKIYNQALTKEQIDTGSATPKANYDFSEGSLADKTGNYPTCQSYRAEVSDDNPVSGKKSYLFGIDRPASQTEIPNATHLDCGVISDNYGIEDSVTVEAWIKLPDETAVTNANGSIISRTEASDRNYGKSEDYIVDLRKKTIDKSSSTEFFYSQIWPEYAELSNMRGMSGFYLQSIGLNGYAPYGLDSPFASAGEKFYDDFDSPEKAEFAVLPSASGEPVLTYQFESFRTGVDDSRYMTAYEERLAKLKLKDSAKASEIDKEVQSRLDRYPYNFNGDGKSFVGQPDSFHQETRKLVADKIIEMQGLLADAPIEPSVIDSLNLSDNQIIATNPYIISLKLKNPADTVKVSKVEFLVDNTLISTSTLPDVSGTYQAVWDTSKYHSVVKVIVCKTDGTTEEVTRNTTVQLPQNYQSPIVTVLPMTGESKSLIQTILGL